MEEQLISNRTAKLAKEKGFNYKCTSFYMECGEVHQISLKGLSNNQLMNFIAAPTQSQLQKWLREEYNIDIVIHRSFSYRNSYHFVILINEDFDNEIVQCVLKNRSYEEALEEALYEALILI